MHTPSHLLFTPFLSLPLPALLCRLLPPSRSISLCAASCTLGGKPCPPTLRCCRKVGTGGRHSTEAGERAGDLELIPHLRHPRACGRDRSRGGQAASTPLRHLTSQADVLHPSRHHQSALTPNLHHQIGTERSCGHACKSWHAASATEGTSPEYHQRPSWRSERGASVRRAAKTGQSQGSW